MESEQSAEDSERWTLHRGEGEGHGKGRVESRVENRVESRREIHVRSFAADTRSQDSDLAQIKDIDELALHREIDLEWV